MYFAVDSHGVISYKTMNEMRELKFRAWDLELEEMFYSDDPRDVFPVGGIGAYPIMQYTGLKDKYDVEIYEGDVLLFKRNYNYSNNSNEFKASVVFENGAFTIDLLHSTLAKINGDYIDWGLCVDWTLGTKSIHNGDGTFEVIGDIHQKPNLLKNQ